MASVLVIGVGTTGLSAIEYAQQFYYEFTKSSSPLNTAFVFIETDEKRKPQVVSNGKTEIQSCYISPKNITATLADWESHFSWMPSIADMLDKHEGAAGHPTYGRLALWSEEQHVRNVIHTMYNRISGNDQTIIYLVGSLTGGTGTGIFIDIAYMVRQVTKNNNIFGMFMLPNCKNVGEVSMATLYENAYSSLKSLDKYSKTENGQNYVCTLPGGTKLDSLRSPFYNVEFFTQDFSNASASIPDLSTLVKSVGFNLVLRLLNVDNSKAPFQDCVNKRLLDYLAKVPDGIFTSVGFNVFQYPESMLEEYLTTKLIHEKILNTWVDTNIYEDVSGSKCSIQGVLSKIRVETRLEVQKAIEESIRKCQGQSTLGNPNFIKAIENEIDKITTKDYKAPSEKHYIFSLFDSNNSGPNLYSAIHGQYMDLKNEMISRIAEYVDKKSTLYQNLVILNKLIEYIGEAIDNVLKDWASRYKIDGTPKKWNRTWQDIIDERFGSSVVYSMLASKSEWYEEALMGTAQICYFNEFMPMLTEINDTLLSRNMATNLATPDGVKLPSLSTLQSITSKVTSLLNQTNSNSLVARENVLKGQLSMNNNSQIYYLYQGESFESDIKNAEAKYSQGSRLVYKDIDQSSLWHFLNSNDEDKIKSQMISKGLSFIQTLKLFDNNNVVSIMKKTAKEHPAYNKINTVLNKTVSEMVDDVPAMVRLVNTVQFNNHNCLKLIIVSELSEDNASGIIKAMANGNTFSATDDNYVQLQSMRNTVVLYQEYGYMGQRMDGDRAFNPLLHIEYQEQVRQHLKDIISSGSFEEKMRLAYLTKEELLDDNIKIK